MSISYSHRAKVPQKDNLWGIAFGNRKNTSGIVSQKDVEIIEAHAMPDHIHMLLSIPPNVKISDFMGYLKGKSTMMIFERYAHMKYKYGNRHFWSRGYYVSTVGGNKQAVQKYIQNQEKEDLISAQINMVEYYDPFEKWLKSNLKKKDK